MRAEHFMNDMTLIMTFTAKGIYKKFFFIIFILFHQRHQRNLCLKLSSSTQNTKWYFSHKTLWKLTRPSIWAFIDYSRTFRSQDMALQRQFSLIWESFIFFVILKLHISIQHPKYKQLHLKYESWHKDLQCEPLSGPTVVGPG